MLNVYELREIQLQQNPKSLHKIQLQTKKATLKDKKLNFDL